MLKGYYILIDRYLHPFCQQVNLSSFQNMLTHTT